MSKDKDKLPSIIPWLWASSITMLILVIIWFVW